MRVLDIVVLLGSGTTAGVMFAVAVSMVPALALMPADRYVYSHQLLGRNWEPTMPVIVVTTTLLDVVLSVEAGGAARVLYALAAALMFGVSAVSQLCNVPLNKTVKGLDPERIPADWADPRRIWRRWHLLRTGFAFAALAVDASAVVTALGR